MDWLKEWAGNRGGNQLPAEPAAQPRPPAPIPAVLRRGPCVMVIPDTPIALVDYADPYQRLLAQLPELLPDQTGGRRISAYPADSNPRGVPSSYLSGNEDRDRQYIIETYGPENAGFISTPVPSQPPGNASEAEKRQWSAAER